MNRVDEVGRDFYSCQLQVSLYQSTYLSDVRSKFNNKSIKTRLYLLFRNVACIVKFRLLHFSEIKRLLPKLKVKLTLIF